MGGVLSGLIGGLVASLCNYAAAVELPFEGGEFVGWTTVDETIEALFT